jgi:hypothetical protein
VSYVIGLLILIYLLDDRYEAACKFLERNGLLSIIRGHEAQDAGYDFQTVSEFVFLIVPQLHYASKATEQKVPFCYHNVNG